MRIPHEFLQFCWDLILHFGWPVLAAGVGIAVIVGLVKGKFKGDKS